MSVVHNFRDRHRRRFLSNFVRYFWRSCMNSETRPQRPESTSSSFARFTLLTPLHHLVYPLVTSTPSWLLPQA